MRESRLRLFLSQGSLFDGSRGRCRLSANEAGLGSEYRYLCPLPLDRSAAPADPVPLSHRGDTPPGPTMPQKEASLHPLCRAVLGKPGPCLDVDDSMLVDGPVLVGEFLPESHPTCRCNPLCHGSISPLGHGRAACVCSAPGPVRWS